MLLDHRTALLPIDLQQGFLAPHWGHRNNPAMEAHGQRLLAAWRARGWPLIHVRHASISAAGAFRPDRPGHAYLDGFAPQGDEAEVVKSVNAAFIGTDLELRLRRRDVNTVVLFGLTTDMCVSTSARVASNLGFRTLVAGDATACFDLLDDDGQVVTAEELSRAHLTTLGREVAEVVNTERLVAAG